MIIGIEVFAFALLSAIAWGFTPIITKRGMARGASAYRATIVILGVNVIVYWIAVIVYFDSAYLMAGYTLAAVVVFVLSGSLGSSVGWLTWFESVDRIGATISTTIYNAQPLFATVFAIILLGERLSPQMSAGIIIVVFGVTVLPLTSGGDLGSWRNRDLLIPVSSAVIAGMAAVVIRFGLITWAITVFQALIVHLTSAFLLLLGYFLLFDRSVLTVRTPGDGFFVGSGILNGIAIFAFYSALELAPVSIITPIAGVAPLITVVVAYFVIGDLERVTWGIVVSAIAVVVGVTLIVTG